MIDCSFGRAEAWATGRAAAAGITLDTGSRRPVPDEEGAAGLAVILLGQANYAQRLVVWVETTTQWTDLEESAVRAKGVPEGVATVTTVEGL